MTNAVVSTPKLVIRRPYLTDLAGLQVKKTRKRQLKRLPERVSPGFKGVLSENNEFVLLERIILWGLKLLSKYQQFDVLKRLLIPKTNVWTNFLL